MGSEFNGPLLNKPKGISNKHKKKTKKTKEIDNQEMLKNATHLLDIPNYQNDHDIVLAFVSKSGLQLKYASSELQNDRGIVLAAVRSNARALRYASAERRNDRQVILAAINSLNKDCSVVFEFASKELQEDRDIVRAAVSHYGCTLKYTSKEFKNDHEISLLL
jgi:hypothetical protein